MRLFRAARLYTAAVLALFHAALLFAVLNLLAWGWLAAFPRDPIEITYGRRAFGVVYPGRSPAEVRELLRETWSRPLGWDPFSGARERRYRGRYVNVHPAGFRFSHGQGPWPPDPSRAAVFVFGGSTTFGYGVADEETIVSALQDELDRRLGPARAACYNFGRGAAFSTGERILFQQLLAEGRVPAVAVFVDGINEFAFGEPFLSDPLRRAVRSPVSHSLGVLAQQLPLSRLLARWKAGAAPRRPEAQLRAEYGDPAVLDGRIGRYFANRRLIAAIASQSGVRPLFVWQPAPTYRYDLRSDLFGDLDFGHNTYSRFGYPRLAQALSQEPLGPDFLWAADLQAGLKQPLYVDRVHYTAAMSRLLGEEVGRALLERGLVR